MTPSPIVCTDSDEIFSIDDLSIAGLRFIKPIRPSPDELTELPAKPDFFTLRERVLIAYDPSIGSFTQVRDWCGKRIYPVAAQLSAEFIPILRTAYTSLLDAPPLPGGCYAAAGIIQGKYVASALPLRPIFDPKLKSINLAGDLSSPAPILSAWQAQHAGSPDLVFITPGNSPESAATGVRLVKQAFPACSVILNMEQKGAGREENRDLRFEAQIVSLPCAQDDLLKKVHGGPEAAGIYDLLEHLATRNQPIILRYQVFPGLSDHPWETAALEQILRRFPIPKVELVAAQVDPERYIELLQLTRLPREQIGIPAWYRQLQAAFPEIRFGYNPHSANQLS